MRERSSIPSRMVCGGCGWELDSVEPYPFHCPNAGDGGDHVVRRLLDPAAVSFPKDRSEPNPFLRYRELLHTYHLARAYGMPDEAFIALVRRLDEAVARVDGRGFRVTPFAAAPALARCLGMSGELWVKDETGNPAGSHKARHLFGLLLHLEAVERLGLVGATHRSDLGVASCGNAALAAAVVAAAGRRRLQVFVPPEVDPFILARLEDLHADVRACPRSPGAAGDPTHLALHAALAEGVLPFTCQGSENGLSVEGGKTVGYEMISDLVAARAALDDLVVQVGGGALASAVAAAFAEAVALGVLTSAPRLHTVQTQSAWPLKRAYDLVAERLPDDAGPAKRRATLEYAARQRSSFMWPWESVPHSIARGILDDETYDWLAVVEAMLRTGGRPVVVGEDALAEANAIAVESTGIAVDATGSAGLAGLIELLRLGAIAPDARVAVLFTGAHRQP